MISLGEIVKNYKFEIKLVINFERNKKTKSTTNNKRNKTIFSSVSFNTQDIEIFKQNKTWRRKLKTQDTKQ